jgi:hypothetical protein
LAKGRIFELRSAEGESLVLDRTTGFWVQEGVTGLGKPLYSIDADRSADVPGTIFYDARADNRQVFLPLDISAVDRVTMLARKQTLHRLTDPANTDPGWLYITDANGTYRLQCYYVDGLGGDESHDLAGANGEESWQRCGLVLQAVDPYFESPTDTVLSWGYSGTVPFFPILPIKLNPGQVLSDAAAPVTNNWFRNPTAETNLTFWDTQWFFGKPNVVLTQDASLVPPDGGSFSVKSVSPSTPADVSGPSQITSTVLTIGVTYTAHCWVYVPSGQLDARLLIDLGPDTLPMTIKDQWIWMKITFTATATSHRMTVLPPTSVTDGSNWQVWVDKFAISEGVISDPSEYIDGDQPNCHWSGTAHSSASYRDAIYQPSYIDNTGTVEAYPVWTAVGPGTQLDINDRARERRITLNYTMAAGEVVIVNTRDATVAKSDGTSLYRYLAEDDFFPLAPGLNAVTASLVGAGPTSSLTVRFKPRLEALV